MNKFAIFLISILVIVVVIGFTKDMIIKASVEKSVEMVTGLKLHMGGMRVGLIKTAVHIKDLRLFNPAGYADRVMLDMPEIYIHYDLPAIVNGRIHLQEVRIDLKEFLVVKNQQGELNLDSLKVVQAEREGKKPWDFSGGKQQEIQIDSLTLKIGKVLYKDYSAGPEPVIKEFDINIDQKYSNITDPYSLVSLIVVKALKDTNVSMLTNFDIQGLQGTIGGTIGTAVSTAQATMEQATGVASQAQKTMKQTTDALKGLFGAKK